MFGNQRTTTCIHSFPAKSFLELSEQHGYYETDEDKGGYRKVIRIEPDTVLSRCGTLIRVIIFPLEALGFGSDSPCGLSVLKQS